MKCELNHDNFQNYKRYNIPKAQLVTEAAAHSAQHMRRDVTVTLLIPDVIREMAFSVYCEKRSAENLAARKAVAT